MANIVIKKKIKKNNSVMRISTMSASSKVEDDPVLQIGDFGTFEVKNKEEIVTGTILEIVYIESTEEDKPSLYIFRVDNSIQYVSSEVEVSSQDIINWTKAGRETITVDELLNDCTFYAENNIEAKNGTQITYLCVNDVVKVIGFTDEKIVGRISSINANSIIIDASTPGHSNTVRIPHNKLDDITIMRVE